MLIKDNLQDYFNNETGNREYKPRWTNIGTDRNNVGIFLPEKLVTYHSGYRTLCFSIDRGFYKNPVLLLFLILLVDYWSSSNITLESWEIRKEFLKTNGGTL